MNDRPRLEARRGMNVLPGFDKRCRVDAGARLDDRIAEAVASWGAAGLVGGADGLPQHAHEPQVQRCGDQIDGGRDSHAIG